MTLKTFGSKLKKLINSPAVFSLLPEGDWGAGGCWMLAEAVKQFLGAPAELVAVVDRSGMVEHILVRYVDTYVDSNGAQNFMELRKSIAEDPHYKKARYSILKFSDRLRSRTIDEGYIPLDQSVVRSLVKVMHEAFPART